MYIDDLSFYDFYGNFMYIIIINTYLMNNTKLLLQFVSNYFYIFSNSVKCNCRAVTMVSSESRHITHMDERRSTH